VTEFSWDPYTPEFYTLQTTGREAFEIQMLAHALWDVLKPASVFDVGCGRGLFLKTFLDLGVPRIFGIDAKPALDAGLVIPRECFDIQDFRSTVVLPRDEDLMICLEVVEHLPPADADRLVELICAARPKRIAFSGAHLNQGGTGHINERDPEYWTQWFRVNGYRMAFAEGMRVSRRWVELCGSIRVCSWYWQNLRIMERFA